MPRPLLLLATYFALLPASMAGAADQGRRILDAPDLIVVVAKERDLREAARRECARRADELHPRILDGTADAAQIAKDTAALGCFGLITTFNGIPAGTSYAPGVECRPNDHLLAYGRLQLLSFSGTDRISHDRTEIERNRQASAAYGAFASSYNAVVIAHPAFPYEDLCRPAAPDYRPSWPPERVDVLEWGLRPLEETGEPRDMHQAARRGTLEALGRLIESHPIDIHVPDLLDLTPLAWAVIYNRPDHMRLLIAAGAHPYGQPGVTQPTATAPFMIARAERNRELAAIMRPAVDARGLSLPDLPAKLDETRSRPVDTGGNTFRLNISVTGQVTDCHLVVEDARFVYPVVCDRIQEATVYIPAENGNGDPVATSLIYTFRQ